MNNSKYRGVVVPMVTPVTQDGQLDAKAVERIIDFFAENKVSPLLMGTTGEGNSVSLPVTVSVNKSVRQRFIVPWGQMSL